MNSYLLAFNGERRDPLSGAYHLGNGYRAYNPQLHRFNAPDSWSPFGAGGINPYIFCAGDPINRADPSGHFNWQAALGIGFSILGVLGAIFTGGSSLVAAGSLSAALTSASLASLTVGGSALVADMTAIASVGLAHRDPHASAVLGWISFASGLLSLAIELAAGVSRMTTSLNKTVWGWDSIQDVKLIAEPRDTLSPVTIFTDMHHGLRRLNVMAHSQFTARDFSARILLRSGVEFNGRRLALEIMQQVNISEYGCARTIICHSADGVVSLADQFRETTGLITTGFRGKVTSYGELPSDIREVYQLQRNPYRASTQNLRFISRIVEHKVINYRNSQRSFSLFDGAGRAYFRIGNGLDDNYQPVTFFSLERNRALQVDGELGGFSI